MSRSKKLPWIKDNGGKGSHTIYRRKVKRRIRQSVRDISRLSDIETYDIPNPKTIVNDYDWCDYKFEYLIPFVFRGFTLEDFFEAQRKAMRK